MLVEKANPALDRIIDASATLETLATGFEFTEGPVWDRKNHCLYFSDIPNSRLHKWSPNGGVTVHREPTFKGNGNTIDHQGRILTCEHVGRRVSRLGPDGKAVAVARQHNGNRLNSPNDIVVKSDGSIYFTDPPFGIMNDRIGARAPQELDFAGVWRVSPDGATLTPVATDMVAPNGLAFSPDESLLYVDDSRQGIIKVHDVRKDGTLVSGRVFAKLTGDGPGVPDGMKADQEGNVYCTGPGGVYILDKSGIYLGRLRTGHTANLAWGDDDWKTLYFTSNKEIQRVRMKVAGIPVGAR